MVPKLFFYVSLTLMFVIPAANICLAQNPMGTAFTYQGRLDEAGSPATGVFDLRFDLYSVDSGGTPLGTVTRDNVTVTAGLFTAPLDFGASAFDGQARWLAIGVRAGDSTGAYTTLTPRQAISPSPCALYATDAASAGNSDQLDGRHATDFMLTSTDDWVNVTGDTMTGPLELSSSGTDVLLNVTNGNTADSVVAVQGIASGTGPVKNYGGYFEAAARGGSGVYGIASSTEFGNYGGKFESLGEQGRGISAVARGLSGIGVQGEASNINADVNYGGSFNAEGRQGVGVKGHTLGPEGRAVMGLAASTSSNINYGGYFEARGRFGRAVYGEATGLNGEAVYGLASATGTVANTGGRFYAKGNSAQAVVGVADAAGAASNKGGHFAASGDQGRGVQGTAIGLSGIGVYGYAFNLDAVDNIGGFFTANGSEGIGVDARALGGEGKAINGLASFTGSSINYGGYFEARSSGGHGVHGKATGQTGIAVFGEATKTGTGTNIGGRFESDGNSGRGIYCVASATGTVTNYGGQFIAYGNSGRGIHADAHGASARAVSGAALNSGNAENYGGYFTSAGDQGIAVYGNATGDGSTIGGYFFGRTGVRGVAESSDPGYNIYGGIFEAMDNSVGTGVYSTGSRYDFYAGGSGTNYAPFTGSHEVQLDPGFPTDARAGMIVMTAGPAKVRHDESGNVSISSTLPTVTLADQPNAKSVFGVLFRETRLPEMHWYKPAEGERFGIVNALGEGRVWVSDAAGTIEMGDYVTTSAIPGYGQRQEDDLQHSYTVGKVIESVDWNSVTETIGADGRQHKVYLIAVVYTCG